MNAHTFVALTGWLVAAIAVGTVTIERSFSQATQFTPADSASLQLAYRGSGRIMTEIDETAFPV